MSDTTAEATVADGEATAVAPQIPVGDGVVMSARERLIAEALKVYGGGAGEPSSPTPPSLALSHLVLSLTHSCRLPRSSMGWSGVHVSHANRDAYIADAAGEADAGDEASGGGAGERMPSSPFLYPVYCILYTVQSILTHATHHQPYSVLDLTPSTDRPLTPPAAIRHTSAAAEPAAAVAKPKAARNVSS